MATWYGDEYTKTRDSTREFIGVGKWHGRVRTLIDHKALVGASVANGEKLYVAKLPSNAVLLPTSMVYHDALTGANAVTFGDANDANNLMAATDMTSAGSVSAMKSVAIENYGKELWALLGYSSDPKTQLDLFFTLAGELSADGDLTVVLQYVID